MFDSKLRQAANGFPDKPGAVEVCGRIEFGTREGDEQMLMHQGAAELIQPDRAGYRLDLH